MGHGTWGQQKSPRPQWVSRGRSENRALATSGGLGVYGTVWVRGTACGTTTVVLSVSRHTRVLRKLQGIAVKSRVEGLKLGLKTRQCPQKTSSIPLPALATRSFRMLFGFRESPLRPGCIATAALTRGSTFPPIPVSAPTCLVSVGQGFLQLQQGVTREPPELDPREYSRGNAPPHCLLQALSAANRNPQGTSKAAETEQKAGFMDLGTCLK